jgi:hypothetical protein
MAKATLVNFDIELGTRILSALDAAGFPVTVALWVLTDEFEDGRLVIGTPLYDRVGPGETSLRFVTALRSKDPELRRVLPVRLVSNKNPLVRSLRRTFAKTSSVSGMRLGGHLIGDVWVDDAYVYKIR